MSDEWDLSLPVNSTLISKLPDEHRKGRTNVATVLQKEHATLGDGNSGGQHKQGSAVIWHLPTTSIPTKQPDLTDLTSADNGRLWHDTTTDIVYVLEDYNDPAIGTGWIVIGHYLGDIAINTDKFTVARDTGNTVIDGTLDVAGIATVAKGSLLASTDAPTTDAMLPNKKYVDDTYLTGQAVQVVNTQTGAVNTGTTQIPYDDSIPQKTEGDEYMTLAITPTNASNKLKIEVIVSLASSIAIGSQLTAALFQDSTEDALGTITLQSRAIVQSSLSFTHYMTADTTSVTTFKVRAGLDQPGTITFNGLSTARKFGGVMASSITITEIKA